MFTPVKIYYNNSMLPYFNQARDEFNQEGISLYGIDWEVLGHQLVITITIEQAERYLIQLGIKVGKAFARAESAKKD